MMSFALRPPPPAIAFFLPDLLQVKRIANGSDAGVGCKKLGIDDAFALRMMFCDDDTYM